MDKLTSQSLRQHANSTDTVAWSGQAKALLKWAADALDAAEQIAAESQQQADRIRELEQLNRELGSVLGDTVSELAEVVEYATRLRAAADTCDRDCIHKALKLPLPKAMQS